ncbi:MAG TPA: thioredoxin family protein [Candidatus Onthosoma merdavium]|nr:thioredoxin family protein [Candidatus Onthosoma merdavium]
MPALTKETQFETLCEKQGIQVFLFSADWCPDCVFLKTFMEELVAEWKQIEFVYVNRDQFPSLCERLAVLGIPSFIAYRDGKECARLVSTLRKSRAEVEAFLGGLA